MSKMEKEEQNNQKKNDLTNALIYCKKLLDAENLLTDTPSEEISAASIAMGKEIFEEIIFMLEDRQITTDENPITAKEFGVAYEEEYEEVHFEFFVYFWCLYFLSQ